MPFKRLSGLNRLNGLIHEDQRELGEASNNTFQHVMDCEICKPSKPFKHLNCSNTEHVQGAKVSAFCVQTWVRFNRVNISPR